MWYFLVWIDRRPNYLTVVTSWLYTDFELFMGLVHWSARIVNLFHQSDWFLDYFRYSLFPYFVWVTKNLVVHSDEIFQLIIKSISLEMFFHYKFTSFWTIFNTLVIISTIWVWVERHFCWFVIFIIISPSVLLANDERVFSPFFSDLLSSVDALTLYTSYTSR